MARVSALHAIHQEQNEVPLKKVQGKKKAAASKMQATSWIISIPLSVYFILGRFNLFKL